MSNSGASNSGASNSGAHEPARGGLDWTGVYRRMAAVDRALDEADQPSFGRIQSVWDARARALAEPRDDSAAQAAGEAVVVFQLGGERYALDVRNVLEIQPLDDLTPVPLTPPHIAGVTIVRGAVLTVLDLRALFELPRLGLTETTRVLVVQAAGQTVALLADAVADIVFVDPAALEAPLAHLGGARATYLRGVTGAMVALLDAEALLSDRRLVVQEDVS
jgi:purine-binding chemotaxis protein CheW